MGAENQEFKVVVTSRSVWTAGNPTPNKGREKIKGMRDGDKEREMFYSSTQFMSKHVKIHKAHTGEPSINYYSQALICT